MAIPSSDTDDLFSLGLIRSYVDKEHNPRFVERHWLKQQINDKLDDSDCRFVLLTGEPGAGKSAFMAWLAQQHPDWCRYFIRRDQRTPLGDPGAHSFLLQVGFQLAAIYPDAFSQEQLKITISQRIGQATDSKTVGAEVEKLFASPFYQKVVQIQQEVSQSRNSRVTGIQIGEWYSDSRLVPLTNLQFMALFDPVSRLLKQGNQQQIVVLVDALDELRYRDPELSLLKWLADCPELSTNLRFVLTCRPDDDLLEIFRGSQQRWIQEVSIAEEEQEVTKDLSHYARLLIETPEVNHFLAEMHQNSDEFIKRAVTKASGNFGYLAAVSRAIDDAIRQNKQELLREILILSDLPDTLQDLYAFFLGKIKEAVDKERVPVKGVDGEIGYISVWSAVYKPILGILSVALEPLNPSQIQKLGLIQVDFGDVIGAIRRLQQFLDSDQVRNCYRFYHSTLPEFLTSPATGEQIAYAYFYVNAVEQNQRIVNYYQAEAKSWEESSLEKIAEDSYGRRYLVRHLVEAKQVKELHQLLNWEKDQKNAWFKLKDDKGEIAEFLDDIELAWFQASEAMDREPGKSIGLQCRYALIKGTINSLSDISEALLVTLLRHQDSNWKNKSFTYARQISDPYRRFDSLAALACQSPDTEALKTQLIEAGLKAALVVPCFNHRSYLTNSSKHELLFHVMEEIGGFYWYESGGEEFIDHLKNLIVLSNKFPEALPQILDKAVIVSVEGFLKVIIGFAPGKLHPNLLPQVLEVILALEDEYNQVQFLNSLAGQLPTEISPEALEATMAIEDEFCRVRGLSVLARSLPAEMLPKVLEAALAINTTTIKTKVGRVRILTALTARLPDILSKALEAALEIKDRYDRSKALTAFVAELPAELLSRALEMVVSIKNETDRAEALAALAAELPVDLLPKALEAALTIRSTDYDCARVLIALADKLPETLPKALEKAQTINDSSDFLEVLARQLPETPIETLIEADRRLSWRCLWEDEYNYLRTLRITSSQHSEVLPKALETAIAIEPLSHRTRVLNSLEGKLSNTLPKVLEAALAIENVYDNVYALAASADVKLSNALPEALEAVLAIKDASQRTDALLKLVEKYPYALPKALEAVLAIKDVSHREENLRSLEKKLPSIVRHTLEETEAVAEKAFNNAESKINHFEYYENGASGEQRAAAYYWQEAFYKLTDEIHKYYVQLLILVLDELPDGLPKLLEAALAIEDESCRNQTLLFIVDKRPDLLLKLLESAQFIGDLSMRVDVLAEMVSNCPKALTSVLKAVSENQSWRTHTQFMNALLGKLPEVLRSKAESMIQSVELKGKSIWGVGALINRFFAVRQSGISSNQRDKLLEGHQSLSRNQELSKQLHSLATSDRSGVLRNLQSLAPEIATFGEEAVLETVQAIQDVSRWWP